MFFRNDKTQIAEVKQTNTQALVLDKNPSVAMIQIIHGATVDPNVDVDKMKAILDMKNSIDDRDAEKAYSRDMVKCQKEIPAIEVSAHNAQTKSNYAKLEHINKKLIPAYTKHGFSISFGTADCPTDGWFRTTATIRHKDGHFEKEFLDLPMDNKGMAGSVNKTEVHGAASTRKYSQRYLVCMIFNIATGMGEDNDGNPPPEVYPVLTKKQADDMWAYVQEHCLETNLDRILKHGKVKKLEELLSSNYTQIMNILEQAAEAKDK